MNDWPYSREHEERVNPPGHCDGKTDAELEIAMLRRTLAVQAKVLADMTREAADKEVFAGQHIELMHRQRIEFGLKSFHAEQAMQQMRRQIRRYLHSKSLQGAA